MTTTETIQTRVALSEASIVDVRGTTSQTMNPATAALLVLLLAAQNASVIQAQTAAVHPNSSTQLTRDVFRDLFNELITFHQQLAKSQRDLPEDAARVLRDNLWQLYD